jgi:inner membrane protein
MDNLTHSLVGAALAEAALPAAADRSQRRLFLAAGILAANLPDADLLYVGITPPPLGYLLHHRGHTHTLVGLLAQGLLAAALSWSLPPLCRAMRVHAARAWGVVGLGLLSHVLLDAGNSYGVHPFHPFDARWYYGDAVFILEPWLWVLLGVPAAWSATGRIARAGLLAVLILLPAAMAWVGVVVPGAVAALAAAAAALAWGTRRLPPQARAAAALGASAAFLAGLAALSGVARHRALALLAPSVRGAVVDVVLNPNPADPVCWMAIAVEQREASGEYVLHRGTLSLLPSWRPPTACASHRFTRGGAGARAPAWDAPSVQSLARLRELGEQDCRVAAWLQFGRAPALADGRIYDLRFENGGGNFTAMSLEGRPRGGGCPANVTAWGLPRADLLRR